MTPSIDLFVFVDALGWEQAQRRQFLVDLLPYRQPCDTLFGYSCTCDPSILTGALPDAHGHFSFFTYAPERSPFRWAKALGWLPEIIAGNHRVRNPLSRWVAKQRGYTGYFQLYSTPFKRLPWLDYTEKRDLYEPGGILGGQPAIFEHWRASGLPWMRSDWKASDAANIATLADHLLVGQIRLAYLINGGLDATMHAHTTTSPQTDAAFARLETWLRELDTLARTRYTEVRWHVFSDHGMADTHTCSRMLPDFEQLDLRYGHDYAAVWDSTMVRFWFPGGTIIRAKIETWLQNRTEGRIVTEAELARWGCFFPDRRYGELFYLLNEGVIFAPSFMNQRRVPAMHGFDPELPHSRACWLTSHAVASPPQRIEAIYPVMRAAADRLTLRFATA
jgi:Type I phosphodiesterase / nucleotide pyrophosphatase